jgi:hypothetical protein
MKQYFKLLQQEIFHAYQSSKLIGHSLPAGNEREIITSRFLERHMPPYVEIGSGIIIDQATTDFSHLNQTTSPQIDLLLAMNHHPGLTFYGGTRFYFAEAVAAVIEVKSRFTTFKGTTSTSELDRVLIHCKKVKERTRQIIGMYRGEGGPTTKTPYYLIAFEADKTALDMLTLLKSRAEENDMDTGQRLMYQPDGLFILDPNNSAVILKQVPDHEVRPANFGDDCFTGGIFPEGGSLLFLWLTLFQQISHIRLLDFPYLSYARRLLMGKQDTGDLEE